MTTKTTKRSRATAAPKSIEDELEPIVLIHADQFIKLLPVPVSYDQIIAWERRKKFPRGLRLNSTKAAPMWTPQAVIEWIWQTYAAFPKHCERAERILRQHPGCKLTAHHRNKPKVTIYSVTDGHPREETKANARDLVSTGAYRWERAA